MADLGLLFVCCFIDLQKKRKPSPWGEGKETLVSLTRPDRNPEDIRHLATSLLASEYWAAHSVQLNEITQLGSQLHALFAFKNRITEFSSVINALKLSGYDVCARVGVKGYTPVDEINPDEPTIVDEINPDESTI